MTEGRVTDDLYSLLTGGLQSALDLEVEKQRARIYEKSLTEDTQKYVRGDDGTVRAGEPASGGGVPSWAIYAGVGLIALGVLAYALKG